MTSSSGRRPRMASLALTAFWGMVTVGRVGFAAIRTSVPHAAHVPPAARSSSRSPSSPIAAAPARRRAALGVLAFALAGLGCSALLPLTISFGQEQLVGDVGRGRRRGDRVLSARLRDRRVRRRPAAGRRRRRCRPRSRCAAVAAVAMGVLVVRHGARPARRTPTALHVPRPVCMTCDRWPNAKEQHHEPRRARSPSSPAATAASARRSCSPSPSRAPTSCIDYVANPQATEELEKQIVGARRPGDRRRRRRQQGRRPADAGRRGGEGVRPARRHGEQRRGRDPHVGPRHDRGAVREGAGHQPQERVLRHAARRQADDQAGRRRPDHQHHVGARGLADARATRPTACPRAACAC